MSLIFRVASSMAFPAPAELSLLTVLPPALSLSPAESPARLSTSPSSFFSVAAALASAANAAFKIFSSSASISFADFYALPEALLKTTDEALLALFRAKALDFLYLSFKNL